MIGAEKLTAIEKQAIRFQPPLRENCTYQSQPDGSWKRDDTTVLTDHPKTAPLPSQSVCDAPHDWIESIHPKNKVTTDPQHIGGTEKDDDLIDYHRNAPKPDAACLYGLVGEIAKAGSQKTEANAYAIAASVLAYLGVAIGRGPYKPTGDDWQHANLFFMHVGRSSIGRKGTAKKLIFKIASRIKELDEHLAPQIHRGGLSSREGLAMMIHDAYKDGKNDVPAINDKRLLIVESELANTLHQTRRDGNTLSTALRDSFDGISIKPATKSACIGTTHPHIGMIADITPSELRSMLSSRELSNGFANRFIIFWSESGVINPFPQATPPDVIANLADKVRDVLKFAGAYRHIDRNIEQIDMTAEAEVMYAKWYRNARKDRSLGPTVTGLLDRSAPVLHRLCMIFALTDQSYVIEAKHLLAAIAWIDYWRESVRFIFHTAHQEVQAYKTQDAAQKIIDFLTKYGKQTRTKIANDCFRKHKSKTEIDAALDDLLTATPPLIEVETVPRPKGKPGTASKLYKLSAERADSADCVSQQGHIHRVGALRTVRIVEKSSADIIQDSAPSAHSAENSATAKPFVTKHNPHNPPDKSKYQPSSSDNEEVL